ncbi:MAG: histidine phosphatase family protein [Actinobacteria bacterium]|nr:histidine phosphatase family protein [Actinomycetota bacterium]
MTSRHQVFVLRHGATEWSKNGRHTGMTDLPLLPEGEKQARATAELLGGRRFALVLSSPLRRARCTCELVGLADQAEITDDLKEWDYGDFEGLTTAQIRETYPDWTVWDGPVPNGEAIADVAARADRVIERARATRGDVALFGHGHMLRVLTARWCELAAIEGRRFPLDTATMNILGWEHEYSTVQVWNERASR